MIPSFEARPLGGLQFVASRVIPRARSFPHLPGGVQLGDLGGAVSNGGVSGQVTNYGTGAKPPWEAILPDVTVSTYNDVIFTVDPSGR